MEQQNIDGPPTIPPLSALPEAVSTFDVEDAVLRDYAIEEDGKYLQL